VGVGGKGVAVGGSGVGVGGAGVAVAEVAAWQPTNAMRIARVQHSPRLRLARSATNLITVSIVFLSLALIACTLACRV